MKKSFILFLGFLLIPYVTAETIFFKKDGAPITPQEHEVIYQIMLENQFPLSLMYGSYKPNEMKAMSDAIASKLPNSKIEARFFPTTLYELFALNFIRDNFENLEQATGSTLEVEQYKDKKILKPKIVNDIRPGDIKTLNADPAVKSFHLNLNNYILEALKKNNLSLPSTTQEAHNILNAINDFWKPLKVSGAGLYWVKGDKNYIDPDVMSKAITLEYNAFERNKFPIYRGSNVLDDEKDPSYSQADPVKEGLYRSISFGNTLLGGIVFDYGACAYCYMSERAERPIGYVLLIDKNEYANGRLRNMFYIPEISSLLDFIAEGEMFHARSKVPDLMNVNKFSFQPGQRGIPSLQPYIPYYQIVASNAQEAQAIYSALLKYIRDNHSIIKQR